MFSRPNLCRLFSLNFRWLNHRPSVISYDNRKILNRLLPCYALSDIGCDRVAKLFVRQLPLYFSLWLEFPFPALRSLVYWRMKDTWTFASPMVNLREINKLIEYFYLVIGQLRLSEFHKFLSKTFRVIAILGHSPYKLFKGRFQGVNS